MALGIRTEEVIIGFLLLLCCQYVLSADDALIVMTPNQNDAIVEDDVHKSYWDVLKPWRGSIMLFFWVALVAICGFASFWQYVKKTEGAISLCRLLQVRDKYSEYNFVSVYSETEADFGMKFNTDDEVVDAEKVVQDDDAESISIIT